MFTLIELWNEENRIEKVMMKSYFSAYTFYNINITALDLDLY